MIRTVTRRMNRTPMNTSSIPSGIAIGRCSIAFIAIGVSCLLAGCCNQQKCDAGQCDADQAAQAEPAPTPPPPPPAKAPDNFTQDIDYSAVTFEMIGVPGGTVTMGRRNRGRHQALPHQPH